MKLRITVIRMGGGYLKAIFGFTRNRETGENFPDAVIGCDEEELLERLKTRLPEFKNHLRRAISC